MASLLGTGTSIGIALSQAADTYGVAEAVTEQLVVESIDWNENATKLQSAGIGSGGIFSDNMERGLTAGTINISGLVGYNNGFPLILAQMLGTSGAPVEQNVGEADYLHTVTYANAINANFLTIAIESSSTTVIEFPSVTIDSLTITATPGGFMSYTATGYFDELIDSSPTNNNAAIQAVSLGDSELVNVELQEEFLLNLNAGGALASPGDRVCITSLDLSMSRPQGFVAEICGTSGNTVPVASDKATGTLTVGLKDHADNTYETAAITGGAAAQFKGSLDVQGTQIGAGDNKTMKFLLPLLVLIDTPGFGLSSPGQNPSTLVFDIVEDDANPTGLSDTTPYAEITNGRTTAMIS